MSVIVECDCGKRFKAKDELAGHSIPCPGCGNLLTIPIPAQPLPSPAKPAKRSSGQTVYPGYPAKNRGLQKEPSRIAISKSAAIYISLFILVPTVIYLVKIGPVNAFARWQAMEPDINDHVTEYVERFLREHREKEGVNMDEPRNHPRLKTIVIDGPVMMIRVPDKVDFQGWSSEGQFKGTYFTKAKRMEGTIEVDDKWLPAKAVVKGGQLTLEK